MAHQRGRRYFGGGRSARHGLDAVAEECLAGLEAMKAAERPGAAGSLVTPSLQLERLSAAAAKDRDSPLARPQRLFSGVAALLDASSPRDIAATASALLNGAVVHAPARLAQARGAADVLLPALVGDCARDGGTASAMVLRHLIADDAALAARARRLGALEVLLRRAAEADAAPAGGRAGATSDIVVESALATAAELCKLTARTADDFLALAATPGCLEQAARWLKRAGGSMKVRAAAAKLLDAVIGPPDAAPAARVALTQPRIVEGVAEAVADAASFGPKDFGKLAFAARGAVRWGGAAAAAAMAGAPGFVDGVAAMLLTGIPPVGTGPEHLLSLAIFGTAVWDAADHSTLLLLALTLRPTRALLEARPRLVGALDACAAMGRKWLASSAVAAGGGARGDAPEGQAFRAFSKLLADIEKTKQRLLQITEADLVADDDNAARAAAAKASTVAAKRSCFACGRGDGGGDACSGAPLQQCAGCTGPGLRALFCDRACLQAGWAAHRPGCRWVPAATAPRRRCCLACGREDGGGGSGGARLLQCGACKRTGLKAFFCDRACLKAGWKTHKPACAAARQRRREQQQGAAGGGGGATA